MGSKRPDHIDLGSSRHFDRNRLGAPSPHDLPSPRSGDVPPALSPLDAFAFHSSVLARQFQEETGGRRLSRLPPLAIAQELSKRKAFLTVPPPAAGHPEQRQQETPAPSGSEPQVETSVHSKHRSYYPFISSTDDASSIAETIDEEYAQEPAQPKETGYFGVPAQRSTSPEPFQSYTRPTPPAEPSIPDRGRLAAPRTESGDSIRNNTFHTLAPPRSPISFQSRSPKSQPSIRQVHNDSGDDYSDAVSLRSDHYDPSRFDRKPSAASISSRPRSPFSPVYPHGRSSSLTSETSIAASIPPRKSMNFSRPMSPAARMYDIPAAEPANQFLLADSPSMRPSIDVLSINESIDSPRLPSSNNEHTTSNLLETTPSTKAGLDADNSGSYIYAKYALPRGRTVPRNSIGAEEFLSSKFNWDSPFLGSSTPQSTRSGVETVTNAMHQLSVPATVDNAPTALPAHEFGSLAAPRLPQATSSMTDILSTVPPLGPRPNHLLRRPSADQVIGKRSMDALLPLEPPRLSIDRKAGGRKFSFGNRERKFSTSSTSAKLISGTEWGSPSLNPKELSKRLERAQTPTVDQTSPETHLAIGIECHESGSLQKSTYHLRLAARAGEPTAMLLYALACRHGWGMRPNATEAVMWLRKAVDIAGLEVADDEALSRMSRLPEDMVNDFQTRKTHKAQLALAFYELGVSYMNGWGVAQEKSSALRCFEIAGNWGDADALAEAGFCYAKGVGCKKDLMRAASLYRKAAEKGISMTGNSWIYKEKYNPRDTGGDERSTRSSDREKEKDKKPRDKSRTRTIFGGRKKSTQQV